MFRLGRGIDTSYNDAVFWYEQATKQGFVQSQTTLAAFLVIAGGEYQRAARWYREAANAGNGQAQMGLGLLYLDGQGVPQDYAQAYFWLTLAAAQSVDGATTYRDEADDNLPQETLITLQQEVRSWNPSTNTTQ